MIKTNNFDKVATDVLKAIKDIKYEEEKKQKYKSDVLLLLGETLESEGKYLEVTEFLKNYDINHKIEHNLSEDDKKGEPEKEHRGRHPLRAGCDRGVHDLPYHDAEGNLRIQR